MTPARATTYKLTPAVVAVIDCYALEGGDDEASLAVVGARSGGRLSVAGSTWETLIEGLRNLAAGEEDMADDIARSQGKAAAVPWTKAGEQLRTLARRVGAWGRS